MLIHFYTERASRYDLKSTGKPKKFEIGDYTHVTFSRGAGGPKNHIFAYFEWWSMSQPKNFMLFFTHYGRSSNPENFRILAHLFASETGGYPLAAQDPLIFKLLAVPANVAGPDRKCSGFLSTISAKINFNLSIVSSFWLVEFGALLKNNTAGLAYFAHFPLSNCSHGFEQSRLNQQTYFWAMLIIWPIRSMSHCSIGIKIKFKLPASEL